MQARALHLGLTSDLLEAVGAHERVQLAPGIPSLVFAAYRSGPPVPIPLLAAHELAQRSPRLEDAADAGAGSPRGMGRWWRHAGWVKSVP